MTSDLVERLRAGVCGDKCRVMDTRSGCICAEAAARIEQLEAALREISDCKTFTDRKYMIDIARAALDYREMGAHSIVHEDGLCTRERT